MLASVQLLNAPQPYNSAQDLSPGKWGPLFNVAPTKRLFFQLVGLPKLPCHHCLIQTEGAGSVSSHNNGLHILTIFFHFMFSLIRTLPTGCDFKSPLHRGGAGVQGSQRGRSGQCLGGLGKQFNIRLLTCEVKIPAPAAENVKRK